MAYSGPAGFDRTRNAVIGNKNFDLTYLEEAYTTEHWLVRIYRVKKPNEFNRPVIKDENRTIQTEYAVSKKVSFFASFSCIQILTPFAIILPTVVQISQGSLEEQTHYC